MVYFKIEFWEINLKWLRQWWNLNLPHKKMSWLKKYCSKTSQVPLFFVNWCVYIYQLPTFFSVFQSKYCFGFPITDLIKKMCICPSLTQAVSITDTKYWRPKMKHFQCLNFNLEASFINLMGHKNVGKSVVNSKICFTFEKIMLKSPTFWPFFSTNLSQKHKMFF